MPIRPTRRTVLSGGALAVAALAVPTPALATTSDTEHAAAADPETAPIRQRRAVQLTGGAAAGSSVVAKKRATADDACATLLSTFAPASDGTVWPDLPLAGIGHDADATGNLGVTFDRLLTLATAFATTGSRYAADTRLATQLSSALQTLADQAYNPSVPPAGNWWFWEIGVPRRVADIGVLMGAALPTTTLAALLVGVRYFAPDPNYRGRTTALAETGANRVDKALSCVLRGALDSNAADLAAGRDALSDVSGKGVNSVFTQVTSGDGFYADGSFIQHTYLPYAGTYGSVALLGIGRTMALLADTDWAVTDPAAQVVYGYVGTTFAPFMWDLHVMDTVRGRAVSREDEPDYKDGFAVAEAALTLADTTDGATATTLRATVKGWLTASTDISMADDAMSTIPQALLAAALLADPSVPATPPPMATTFYAAQERLVHRTRDWAFTVSTSSSRIGRFEWGNDENKHGWYQGDGAAYLYHRSDPGQFGDSYWPVQDPTRLPGITAPAAAPSLGQGAGTGIPRAANVHNGGITLGGGIGTVATDVTDLMNAVSVKKSWHSSPDGVVCVGSNVSISGVEDVVTVIDSRLFDPADTTWLTLDGRPVAMRAGGHSAEWRRFAHVRNHAGFVLLSAPDHGRTTATAQVRRLSGTWHDINSGADTGGDTVVHTKDAVGLQVPHDADHDHYAYLVLPLASLEATWRWALFPQVSVAAADEVAHVVEHRSRSALTANFFTAGTRAGITADAPCAVGWVRSGRALSVSVSDPTHTVDELHLRLPVSAGRLTHRPGRCRDARSGRGYLELDLVLTGSRGAQQVIRFS